MATKVEEEEPLSEEDKKEWQEKIMSMNNKRLLEFIRDLISARIELARASWRASKVMEKKETKDNGCCTPYGDYDVPNKLPPVHIESENPDENP